MNIGIRARTFGSKMKYTERLRKVLGLVVVLMTKAVPVLTKFHQSRKEVGQHEGCTNTWKNLPNER